MPSSDGYKNLVPFGQRSVEEQRAIQSAGGKASGVSRRRQKTQAEIIRQIMALKLTVEEGAEKLEALGLDPTWATDANVAVMQKARKGDVESLRYLRDTIGEKPRDGLEIGNLDGQPIATMDLSAMTDDQLRALIAAREQSGEA
jgi:hypothetical protein